MPQPDVSMYPKPQGMGESPLEKAIEQEKMIDTIRKVRGGMPQTQSALGLLGAGQPYPTPMTGDTSDGQ